MKRGRPSDYTPELADRICAKVAACVPVHKIAALPGMPTERTIYRWLKEYPDFCQDYVRAREQQADRMVAECREIADTEKDKMGAVERDRLRVQVRQWSAERMAPKKYGTRTTIAGDPDAPLRFVDLSRLSDAALAELEASLDG